MDTSRQQLPDSLPTLEEIQALNKGKDIPPETAWIWSEKDEVIETDVTQMASLM